VQVKARKKISDFGFKSIKSIADLKTYSSLLRYAVVSFPRKRESNSLSFGVQRLASASFPVIANFFSLLRLCEEAEDVSEQSERTAEQSHQMGKISSIFSD